MVTQAQITRAVKAVRAAGLVVAKVEIDADGKVVVTSAVPGAPVAEASPLEKWRAERARASQGH
jgi:hypothetical protein